VGDPFLEAARAVFRRSFDELRGSADGLPAEALNWRPVEGANSIAVLVTHSLHSTRSWLSVALGVPLPERDRESEFRAAAGEPSEMLALLEAMSGQCLGLLDGPGEVDWTAMRRTHPRLRRGEPQEVPAAWALLHALEHLREHAGQAFLTRQLWEAT
jgi:uncharacterized damage-inducible protein DinB